MTRSSLLIALGTSRQWEVTVASLNINKQQE